MFYYNIQLTGVALAVLAIVCDFDLYHRQICVVG